MHVIIACKYKKDRMKKQLRKCGNTVFYIITLWELFVAMETRVWILVAEIFMFEIVYDGQMDGRTTDGRRSMGKL